MPIGAHHEHVDLEVAQPGQQCLGHLHVADDAIDRRVDAMPVEAIDQMRLQRGLGVFRFADSGEMKQRDLIGIENLQDMTNFTPGLVYSSVLDRVTLRGVGRQTNLLSADAAVTTYVDGFFTTSAVEASKDPMFVSNVEVLRGPQGTLQGRNAIGGALLVTTARPTSTPYAEVRETIGNMRAMSALACSIEMPGFSRASPS